MRDVLSPQLIRRLFEAQSIALLGASDDATRIGGRPLRLLRKFGFSGVIVPINVHRSVVQGERSYPSLRDVPHPVDLAIVALRADLVPKSISDCIDLGVGSIVIYTSGLGELGSEGGEVEFQMASLAEQHDVALLGPNCLGALDVHRDLPLTFSAVLERGMPRKGSLGIVSQSGAIGMTILAACRERGVGISKWISTGNEASLTSPTGSPRWPGRLDFDDRLLSRERACGPIAANRVSAGGRRWQAGHSPSRRAVFARCHGRGVAHWCNRRTRGGLRRRMRRVQCGASQHTQGAWKCCLRHTARPQIAGRDRRCDTLGRTGRNGRRCCERDVGSSAGNCRDHAGRAAGAGSEWVCREPDRLDGFGDQPAYPDRGHG